LRFRLAQRCFERRRVDAEEEVALMHHLAFLEGG
jgi:hypothetical protein